MSEGERVWVGVIVGNVRSRVTVGVKALVGGGVFVADAAVVAVVGGNAMVSTVCSSGPALAQATRMVAAKSSTGMKNLFRTMTSHQGIRKVFP